MWGIALHMGRDISEGWFDISADSEGWFDISVHQQPRGS